MKTGHPILKGRRVRNAGAAALIVVAHLGVFAVMGRAGPSGPVALPTPVIEVLLERPPEPPPPPPPSPTPSPVAGGGAPAAPSRIHTPPPPPDPPPDSPPAPREQAPAPDIVLGVTSTASDQPGLGQGGQGAGTGTGVGEGDGPGSGSGALILRGATGRQIFDTTPRELRRRARNIDITVNCEVALNERLVGCRVVRERPAGQGFGPVAVRVAESYFQVRPPMTASGRPIPGGRITIGVVWP